MGKTVVIVDDHAGFRASARRLLEADGFDVVGEAADGRSGIAAVIELRPQIVLLDIRLPDIDGIAVASELTRRGDAPAIVLTSSHDRDDFGESIEASGAHGFVPKDDLCGATVAAAVA
jgi:DNA-binding NarL/FixJ family response regulator